MPVRPSILVSMIVVAVLAAAAAGPAEDSPSRRVIRVMSSPTSTQNISRPPSGLENNVVSGTSRLENVETQFGKPRGAVVGHDRFRFVFKTTRVAVGDVTAVFSVGALRCHGKLDVRRASILRLSSGTGAFAGASGTCEAKPALQGRTLNVYRFRIER